MRRATPVTVLTADGVELNLPWVTSAEVTRDGTLQLRQGWTVRMFFPAGDWKQYMVRPPQILADQRTKNLNALAD